MVAMKIDINNFSRFYYVNDGKYLKIEENKRSYVYFWKLTDVKTNLIFKKFETFEQVLLYLLDNKYSVVDKKDLFDFNLLIKLRPAESEFIADILSGIKQDYNFKHYFRNLSQVIINKIKA